MFLLDDDYIRSKDVFQGISYDLVISLEELRSIKFQTQRPNSPFSSSRLQRMLKGADSPRTLSLLDLGRITASSLFIVLINVGDSLSG